MKSQQWPNALVSALFLTLSAGITQAATRYAVPTGGATSGSCDSWANACTLTAALSEAGPGDEVWVMAGTYKPGTARAETFLLEDGVQVKGAYKGPSYGDGTERELPVCTDGDPTDVVNYNGRPCAEAADCGSNGSCNAMFVTILSGDIDGTPGNSYHVVTFAEQGMLSPLLEGFSIEDGCADGTGTSPLDDQGAGIQLRSANWACAGGSAASITVRDCLIRNNYARNHGAVNDHYADSSFQNCVFRNNVAGKGAGLLVDNGSPTVTNCLFDNNKATTADGGAGEGGGAWTTIRVGCQPNPAPMFDDCVFISNEAIFGGGAWSAEPTSPTFKDCTFSENLAIQSGGGIFARDTKAITIIDCQFLDNETNLLGVGSPSQITGGAGVWIERADTSSVSGSLFARNISSGPVQTGGGLYMLDLFDSGAPVQVQDCEFRENEAGSSGGAVYNQGDAQYARCLFIDNSSGNGGASYINAETSYTDCSFLGNTGSQGGATFVVSGPITWINCLFSGNSATASGGAVRLGPISDLVSLVNCTVSENHATGAGGGIYELAGGAVTVQNCIVWGNTDGDAGTDTTDEQLFGSTTPTVTYSCIQDDDPQDASIPFGGVANNNIDDDPIFVAPTDYGDFRLEDGSPCTDAGNDLVASGTDLDGAPRILGAAVDMGAYECNVGCDDGDICTFDRCETSGCVNTVSVYGDVNHDGAVDQADLDCVLDGFGGMFVNCSFQDVDLSPCTPDGDIDLSDLLAVINAVDGVDDCCGQCTTNAECDDGVACTSDTCNEVVNLCQHQIDNGSCDDGFSCNGVETCHPTDDCQAGTPVTCSGTVDCTEQCCRTVFVNDTAAGVPIDGTTWSRAYRDLQDALTGVAEALSQGSISCAQIWVAAGTYKPTNQVAGARSETFLLQNNVAIYGGFIGNEVSRTERDYLALPNQTFLSGDIGDPDPDDLDNAYHVVTANNVDRTAVLDGFFIVLGRADGAGATDKVAGGLWISDASPTITNTVLLNNGAASAGGGVYNSGTYSGTSAVFTNCVFGSNFAYLGGGMVNENSNPALMNGAFLGNLATAGGGAVYSLGTTSAPTMINCSVVGNQCFGAGATGGGVYIAGGSITVANTILWLNTSLTGNLEDQQIFGALPADVSFSNIQGLAGLAGNNNIGDDPVSHDPDFVDAGIGNVRLSAGSPSIGAGSDLALPNDVSDVDQDGDLGETLPLDLDLIPRINGTVDMGAYESGL